MTRNLLAAVAALTVAAGTPALAQSNSMASDQMSSGQMSSGQMSSGKMMHMSAADKRMMTKCQGMSHDMMMKNKGCMKMMKMHPGMMQGG